MLAWARQDQKDAGKVGVTLLPFLNDRLLKHVESKVMIYQCKLKGKAMDSKSDEE